MRKLILLVCLFFTFLASFSQSHFSAADSLLSYAGLNILGESYTDTASISEEQILILRKEFGKNKRYDPAYEKLVLPALSYFPQLKNYRITFKVRNHGVPLSTRPSFGSIFRHAKKREYMIFISTDTSTKWKDIQMNRVPLMAQFGIIGHEISHIIEFKEKSSFGMMGLGISHISTSYMNKFEFQADSICVAQGMGNYLLAWSTNARRAFGAQDPEQLGVKGEMYTYNERYMSPATIRRYMEESIKNK